MSGTDPFKVVLASDPAIDTAASNLGQYVADRDVEALSFVDGEEPTIYWCRPLSRAEIREVRNKATEGDKYEAAFVRGLVKVERLMHPDGSRRDWLRPDDRSGKSKPIPDSALETYFSEAEIAEVGMVVMMRSFLARSSGGYYPLPGISQAALTASLYRRAVQTRDSSSSETSSDSPAAPSAQTTSQASES